MANSLHFAKPELAFVAEASMVPGDELSVPQNISWDEVLDLAAFHRVYPRVARTAGGLMPDEAHARITTAARSNAQAALRNLARTRETVQILESNGVDTIVLKGPLLARELYGDVALRVAGDIDLLIREPQLSRAARILDDAGYRTDVALGERALLRHRRRQHDVAFVHPEGDALIELHADLAQPHYGVSFDLEEWWADRGSVQVAGTQLGVLKPEHSYLFAAVHAAKHRWERLDLICDLAAYARKPLDWRQIDADAAEAWLLKTVRTGQRIAAVIYGRTVDESPATRAVLKKIVGGESFGRAGGIRFDMALRERRRDQVGYLLRRLLSAKLEV